VNKNPILGALLLIISAFYVLIITSKNYVLLDLVYALGLCCLSIISTGGTAFIMFKARDRERIGWCAWVSLFARSQVLSTFMPGVGVLYRANVLKKDSGVSLASSTAAFLRALSITVICFALMAASMYWKHLLEYKGITILFIGFLTSGVVLILIPKWDLLSLVKNTFIENKLIEHTESFNTRTFSAGNLSIFISLFMVSAITISAAYLFLVRGAHSTQISVFDSLNIFVAMKALSFAPSFIPANFGLQEFILIGIDRLANIGISDIITFSLMIRLMNFLANLFIVMICQLILVLSSEQKK